jgi:osmotically-inducible protein OsmY
MISIRSVFVAAVLAACFLSPAPSPVVAQKRNVGGPADLDLREKLVGRISRDRDLVSQRLSVVLANGGVFLSGRASNCNIKQRAFSIAASTFGVINVTDLIVVKRQKLSDDSLRGALLDALEPQVESLGIEGLEVTVENSIATLEGTTPNLFSRIKAEEAAGTVFGITEIVNRLQPRDAPSGTDDTSIAEAVLAYLGDAKKFGYSAEIEIAVEDGVVTLSGPGRLYVALHQASMMAKQVGGVKRVESKMYVDPSLGIQLPLVGLASR